MGDALSGQVRSGHALIEDGGRSGALYSVSSNSYNELISICEVSLSLPLPPSLPPSLPP